MLTSSQKNFFNSALAHVFCLGAIVTFASSASAQVSTVLPSAIGASQRSLPPARDTILHKVKSSKSQSIAPAVLVNDEPITNYEISKRQALLGSGAKGVKKRAESKFKQMLKSPSTKTYMEKMIKKIVAENPGKSREEIIAIINKKKKQYALSLQKRAVSSARASIMPGLKKKALEELINERLKTQEAKRLNLLVSDEDVDSILKNVAKNNKMTLKQFAKHLKGMGSDIETIRSRYKAMLSWRRVIRAKFGQQIAVNSGDIDRYVAKTKQDSAANSQFNLQRIALAVPANAKPNAIAQRLNEANAIRNSFTNCKNTGKLVKNFGGARLEILGDQNATKISEPTRSMILNAADGEMLPPEVKPGSVQLWIVCGRKTVNADIAKRSKAKDTLKVKEFDIMAQRHLKDLRQDAHIEYK